MDPESALLFEHLSNPPLNFLDVPNRPFTSDVIPVDLDLFNTIIPTSIPDFDPHSSHSPSSLSKSPSVALPTPLSADRPPPSPSSSKKRSHTRAPSPSSPSTPTTTPSHSPSSSLSLSPPAPFVKPKPEPEPKLEPELELELEPGLPKHLDDVRGNVSHTRRCRAKVNSYFDRLMAVLPPPLPGVEVKHKAQMLNYAIDCFQALRRHNMNLEMRLALSSRVHLHRWVSSVVARSNGNLSDALKPFMAMICLTKGWKYAELWAPTMPRSSLSSTQSMASSKGDGDDEERGGDVGDAGGDVPQLKTNSEHKDGSKNSSSMSTSSSFSSPSSLLRSPLATNTRSCSPSSTSPSSSVPLSPSSPSTSPSPSSAPPLHPRESYRRSPRYRHYLSNHQHHTHVLNHSVLRYVTGTVAPSVAGAQLERVKAYRAKSKRFRFRPRCGVPGRVFLTKRPEWLPYLTDAVAFPRAPHAIRNKVELTFAVPVIVNGSVKMVVQFYDLERRPYDSSTINLALEIADLFGKAFTGLQTS